MIVAGNWKMNKTLQEGLDLAKEVNDFFEQNTVKADVIIAPPFIHLAEIAKGLTRVKLSAQNSSSEPAGFGR